MLEFIGRPAELRLIPYADCRDQFRTGMVLCYGQAESPLVRGLARLIQKATNSDYFHVAVAGWDRETDVLLMAESTVPESRIVPVSAQVKAYPGAIDIYALRLDPEVEVDVDVRAMWQFMERAGGINYPEVQLLLDWLHILTGRGQDTPNCDIPDGQRRVCSQLLHAAFRVAGLSPLAELDALAFPRAFADPRYWVYQFTPTL